MMRTTQLKEEQLRSRMERQRPERRPRGGISTAPPVASNLSIFISNVCIRFFMLLAKFSMFLSLPMTDSWSIILELRMLSSRFPYPSKLSRTASANIL